MQQDTSPGIGTFLPYEHRAVGSLISPAKITHTEKWHELWLTVRDSLHNDIPRCFSRVHRADSLTSSCSNATHLPAVGVQHRDTGPTASGDKPGWAARSHGECDVCPQPQQLTQNPENELRPATLHGRWARLYACVQRHWSTSKAYWHHSWPFKKPIPQHFLPCTMENQAAPDAFP